MAEKNQYGIASQQWRAMRGYSQDYMAKKLGLNGQRAYARLESGESPWDLDLLEKIVQIVDAKTLGRLLSLEERISFNDSPQAHAFGSNNTYNGGSEKERELYETLIHGLQEDKQFLQRQLDELIKKS